MFFLKIILTLTISALWSIMVDCRRPICDRSLLSICYNQLQPFFLTNNLRMVLRGWALQNVEQPQPFSITGGNKHGRSQQPQQPQKLPLHRIFSEFREFCDLYSTFSECLEAHDASDCMQADLVGELNSVIVTVARRDRSDGANNNNKQPQQQPLQSTAPTDLTGDFDHYRRLANSFCVDTPENMQIHIVRCLAHAVSAFSLPFRDNKQSEPDYTLPAASAPNSVASTCTRWLRQSQAPLVQAFFRQDGCGEHLSTALRLSAFLAELTMRTTNATESVSSPKFAVCVRHMPPKIFQSLINETFSGLVSPTSSGLSNSEENTQKTPTIVVDGTAPSASRVVGNSLLMEPLSVEELIAGKDSSAHRQSKLDSSVAPFPILSIEQSATSHDDWLDKNTVPTDGGMSNNRNSKEDRRLNSNNVVIPVTADDESNRINEDDGSDLADATDVGYDDEEDESVGGGRVLGVSLMMADSPLLRPTADNQRRSAASPPLTSSLFLLLLLIPALLLQ